MGNLRYLWDDEEIFYFTNPLLINWFFEVIVLCLSCAIRNRALLREAWD
jgi:hypothetical protein